MENIDGIGRKIDEFFQFYQGISVSSEDLGGSSEKRMGKAGISPFDQPYAVVTDQEAYRIVFSYTAYDEADEDQVGLHSILIMTQALADEAKFWQWPAEDSVKSYIPSTIVKPDFLFSRQGICQPQAQRDSQSAGRPLMPQLKGCKTRAGRSGPQMILKKAPQNYTFCGAFSSIPPAFL